jgi:hypothetical protein
MLYLFYVWNLEVWRKSKLMFVSLEKEERRVESRGRGKRRGRGEGSEELFLIPLI